MLDRMASKRIDPKTAGIKLPMRAGILTIISSYDRFRSQLTGTERI